MTKSLKEKTVYALLWNLLDRFSQQICLLVIGIWLARLLSPADFGLIGTLSIFIALAPIFLDSGFSVALIRQEKLNEQDATSAFYFNLFISLLLYLLLFFSAPLIASFFKRPELIIITRVLFISLIFNSLTLIQTVIFSKQVNFRILTIVNLISTILAGTTAIYLAYTGFAVWSLIWQTIVLAASRMVLLWTLSNWRPKFFFSFNSLKELLSFSYFLVLANIIYSVFQNFYSVIIGRLFPIAQLGYYTQGTKLSDMPVGTLYSTIQNATLPVFSTIQNEKERLINAYRKTVRFASFISCPALLGLTLIAHPLVNILLTSKWIEVVPFFQLLCIAGIFTVFIAVNQNFMKIQGNSKVILKLEIFKIALIAIALVLTINKGIIMLVVGQVVVRALACFSYMVYVGKHIDYPWKKQAMDILPYFVISLIIVIPLYISGTFIGNDFVKLAVQIPVAVLLYFIINKILGSKILKDMLDLLFKNKMNKQYVE
jgi:teichuronic acid exporter